MNPNTGLSGVLLQFLDVLLCALRHKDLSGSGSSSATNLEEQIPTDVIDKLYSPRTEDLMNHLKFKSDQSGFGGVPYWF